MGYTYDAAGRRTSLTYPDNTAAGYAYDAADRLTSVTDWNSNVTAYSYDNAGQLTSTTFPNGVVETRAYNDAGELTSVGAANGSTTITSNTYVLDAVGNRMQAVDLNGTSTYAYDDVYRVTGVGYPNGDTQSYTYDPQGNRLLLVQNGVPTNYSYDNADHMTLAGGVTYSYDNNGNQVARGADTFSYDSENRLVGSSIAGIAATYAYNGDGVRTGRTVAGVAVGYVWDVANELPVVLTDTAGNKYLYGLGRISVTNGSSVYYFQADGLGSTGAITDASGAVVNSYQYDVFGATRSQSGVAPNEFTFVGEQMDPSAMQYLRARYYDPATGRFMSQDPIPFVQRYAYVGNNPVNLVDPTGQCWRCVIGAVVGGGSGLVGTYVGDVAQNVADGGSLTDLHTYRPRSSFTTYLENTAQGAVIGVVCGAELGLNPYACLAGATFVTDLIRQGAETHRLNMCAAVGDAALAVLGEGAFRAAFPRAVPGRYPSDLFGAYFTGSHARREYIRAGIALPFYAAGRYSCSATAEAAGWQGAYYK